MSTYSQPPCRLFQQGRCTYGETCRFSHDPNMMVAPGGASAGGAFGGAAGAPGGFEERAGGQWRDPAVHGLPRDQFFPHSNRSFNNRLCHEFQNTGSCKYGRECRFTHAERGMAPQFQGYGAPNGFDPSGAGFIDPNMGGGFGGDRFARPYGDDRFGNRGGFGNSYGGFGSSFDRSRRPAGPCYDFRRTGQCRFGEGCRFSHQEENPSDRKICHAFRDTGSCTYGDRCRFSHEAPAPFDQSVPTMAPESFPQEMGDGQAQ